MQFLTVAHGNLFVYNQSVSIARHALRLTPRNTPHQRCYRTEFLMTPMPDVNTETIDFYGNTTHFVTVQEEHSVFAIEARSLVEVAPGLTPNPLSTPPWESVRDDLRSDITADGLSAYDFSFDSPYSSTPIDLRDYALKSFTPGRPILDAAIDLMNRVFDEFEYDGEATDLSTPVAEVYEMKRGVCQDFAHFMIACIRQIALPARYVSGYLLTYPPKGQEKLIGSDASHAWCSIYCPGSGWIDLDPTNNKIPGDEHITLAWGRDYSDVSPIRGVIVGGAGQSLEVAVDVRPVSGPEAVTESDPFWSTFSILDKLED